MADTWRAVLKGWLAGTVQTRSMFTAEINLVSPNTIPGTFATYLLSILEPIQPYISTIWACSSFDTYFRTGTQWEFIEETPFTFAGEASSEPLANLIAGVMIGKAGGIRQIGRKFIPGLAEAAVNGNSLVTGAVVAFGEAVAAYVTPFTTAAGTVFTPGIINKSGVFKYFVSGVVSSLLGTMRRRKPGLGI